MDKESIIMLKGPDRVRKRPAVVFFSDGLEGSTMVVKKLIDIFVNEAALGYSSKIEIKIHKDNSISIRSYDRGLILDEDIVEDKPAWYMLFCELYYGVDLKDPHAVLYGKPGTFSKHQLRSTPFGLDLCCIQYVSRFMHIESVRDGIKKTLDFEKGYSVSELRKEQSSESPNTYVHFLIDEKVFDDIKISGSEIVDFLRDAAITVPGLECKICDERDDNAHTFLYPRGAEDYALEAMGSDSIPLFSNEIAATGRDRYNFKDYDAKIKVVIGFAENASKLICLHNSRELEYGGEHLDALKKRLMHYINWEFIWDFKDDASPEDENNYHSRRRFELSFDDIKDVIVLILETDCPPKATRFINESRKSIENHMITDMAYDLLSREFGEYLKQNHEAIFSIFNAVRRSKKNGEK